jgi:hypothetical protein
MGEKLFLLGVVLFIALAFIFFSEEIGSYTGPLVFKPSITTRTPGIFIKIFGFIFLGLFLLGIIALIFEAIQKS